MSGAEASPQPVGVVWHMATTDAPAAPAAALPARFGRVRPEAQAELAQAMGQDGPALVRRRFEAGRRCYAAWTGGQLAAYGWVSFGEEHVGELGMHLRLMPNEAYIWDCLTLAAYRRRRLYTALLGHMAEALRVEGVQAIWIGADFDNRPSQAGIARAGFTAVADLVAAPPNPGEQRRRAWLQARPGISQTLLAEARRAYMGGSDEVWLFDNQR
jgi:ribosomal protein S18 acetylase RimI-like enzyme